MEEFENVRPISCLAVGSRAKYTRPVGATFDFIHAKIISVVGSESSSESVAQARGSSFKTMFHVGQTCPMHERACCSTQTEDSLFHVYHRLAKHIERKISAKISTGPFWIGAKIWSLAAWAMTGLFGVACDTNIVAVFSDLLWPLGIGLGYLLRKGDRLATLFDFTKRNPDGRKCLSRIESFETYRNA